jgi:DNA end-binding protein Ku
LNRASGHRVESRYRDAETGKLVAEENEAKGYQTGPDDYVILEDEELESVALESTRTIDIDMFVPADAIGWIWYDRPHYLVPDDPVGEEAFAVIRDAMAATDMVGIARLVLYRRERAVMLQPSDRGIVVWTLRYGDEVRPADAYFGELTTTKVNAKQLALVTQLIEERIEHWDPAMVGDPVQEQLLQIIEAKKKGRRPTRRRPAAEEPRGQVLNIMDALRRSIAAETGKKGR